VHASYETVGDPGAGGPFLFTCEHATNELPEWTPEPEDRALLADHWGWDVGAADLTRALAELTGSCAVLSRFSRLVCDPNRDPEEASFVVEAVEGHALSWNRGVGPAERRRKVTSLLDRVGIGAERRLQLRKFSKGMIQRVGIDHRAANRFDHGEGGRARHS